MPKLWCVQGSTRLEPVAHQQGQQGSADMSFPVEPHSLYMAVAWGSHLKVLMYRMESGAPLKTTKVDELSSSIQPSSGMYRVVLSAPPLLHICCYYIAAYVK